jgi:muconate cycloisomerase
MEGNEMAKRSDGATVRELEIFSVYVPFKRAHKIALGTAEGRHILIVRLRTTDGLEGIGEAIAHPAFSGETLEALRGAARYLEGSVLERNPLHVTRILAEMDARLYGNYGAKTALEMALLDLAGKRLGLPIYDLLGGCVRERFPISRSVSQSDLAKDIHEAKEFVAEGYPILKVKVGILSVRQDVERIAAVRESAGPAISLRADANQGWNTPKALQFIEQVRGYDLAFVEQPLPFWDVDGLAAIRRKSSVPIMADESAATEHDVLNVIKKEAADFISIKILKTGGIMGARRVAALARCAGIQCYLGSQAESSIGTAAGLHLALATEGFDHGGEIYGPAFFVDDLVRNPVRIDRGYMYPPEGPGLGVELDMDKLRTFAVK